MPYSDSQLELAQSDETPTYRAPNDWDWPRHRWAKVQ